MMLFPDRRTFIKAAIGGVAGTSLSQAFSARTFAQAGASRIAATLSTEKLSDNLVLLTGAGANVVAMTGADGVVMVDGGLAEHAAALLAAVSGLSGGTRVHTLFNTHWHPEQTGSNQILGKAGATIIAHENTRLWLTTDITRPWEKRTFQPLPKEARPNKTFYSTGAITVGSERIEYGYLLQAHTDGDIYVFFPKSNVLIVGGVISGDGWPLIDWWTGGWIGGLVNGLETLLKVGNANTRVVSANGPVMTRADLQAQYEMYKTISTRLQAMIRKGRSPDEALAAEPTKEFNNKMGNPEMFVRLAFQSMWGQLSPDA
jgi:glyoxylase-like metal-dependent hydrolase (beta-lactamase superfamily II)